MVESSRSISQLGRLKVRIRPRNPFHNVWAIWPFICSLIVVGLNPISLRRTPLPESTQISFVAIRRTFAQTSCPHSFRKHHFLLQAARACWFFVYFDSIKMKIVLPLATRATKPTSVDRSSDEWEAPAWVRTPRGFQSSRLRKSPCLSEFWWRTTLPLIREQTFNEHPKFPNVYPILKDAALPRMTRGAVDSRPYKSWKTKWQSGTPIQSGSVIMS